MSGLPADARLAVIAAALSVGAWWVQAVPTLRAPPAGAHAWRETDGLIVARNYCDDRAAFLEPRIDARGETPGRTGLEFPVLNWVSGQAGCATGDFVTPWRLISFVLTLLGAAALFFFAHWLLGLEGAALTLASFATSPLVPYFSRTTQPDVAAMAFAILALALTQSRLRWAAPAALSLAMLLKLPGIVYGLPMVLLLWQGSKTRGQRALSLLLSAASLVPPALWYHHARTLQLLDGLETFAISRSPAQLWHEWQLPAFWVLNFVQRPFDTLLFPLAGALLVLVAAFTWRQGTRLGRTLALTWLGYVFACGYSGAHHEYYGLMVLPLAAVGSGWALRELSHRLRLARPGWLAPALVVFFVAALGWQVNRIKRWWPTHLDEWAELSRFSQETIGPRAGPRLMVFTDGSPETFWFMHQLGWLGDTSTPTVAAGRFGVVDRLRLREDARRVEVALGTAGCAQRFENAVAWVCEQPKP